MKPENDKNPHECPVPGHGNRLQNEKSPYLRQHAQDPVDWYPWGDEAFTRAQKEDKPVFLSIGYSTCHWCHVMAGESFRDPAVAKLLNKSFIAVKVDREERPDIDRIYMTACQAMTGTGGWPLSLFLTPEKKPFFAATYIPKEQKFGSIGMMDLLPRIAQLWNQKKTDLLGSAGIVSEAVITSLQSNPPGNSPGREILTDAFEALVPQFDPDYGGFGPAPKFPMPSILLFLLRYWKMTGSATALSMVTRTLDGIFRGGIYDQVGGGVHRYSTDARWRIPHFEKMLYDQALLAIAFTETSLATGNSSYRSAATEIFTYMQRDLGSPDGAFFSAEDADSPGGEGAFYTWTADEFVRILLKEDEPIARAVFNVMETDSDLIQGNVLYRSMPAEILAERFSMTPEALFRRIETIKNTLFTARNNRPRPMRDEKILADWNGFAIAAFARAAQAFGNTEYASVAARAASFILASMRMPDGGVYHRYCCGEPAIAGFADDYAGLVWGLTELYEATFDNRYLDQAIDLTGYLIAHFHDPGSGCFFSTADTTKELFVRTQEFSDGVVPSANSLTFYNLLRLSRLTEETGFEDLARKIPPAAGPSFSRNPSAYGFLLCALDFATGNPAEVVIAGQYDDPGAAAMIDVCRAGYYPSLLVRFHNDPRIPGTIGQPVAKRMYHTLDGKATAYFCTRQKCLEPVTNAARLKELLESPGNYRLSGK